MPNEHALAPPREAAIVMRVAEMAERAVHLQELDALMAELVSALHELPGYDVVGLFLVEPDGRELVLTELRGAEREKHLRARRPITSEGEGGLVGRAAHLGKPLSLADVATAGRHARTYPAVRSALAVPLRLDGSVIGVISAESTAAGWFGGSDRRLLETLAAQLVIAVQNARLSEELAQARREVAEHREQLERLASNTVELQERERGRIACDLHDGMTQTLFGALYQLDAARSHAERSPAESRKALQRLRSLIVQCVDETDRIVHDLRPVALDDLGLVAALERYANDIRGGGDDIAFEVCGRIPPLDPRLETTVYRFVQEALTNAVKHSRADRVRVRLVHLPTHLDVSVSDDGVGFREAPDGRRGLGLLSIRERADRVGATVDVRSAPGRGTTLSLQIPLDESRRSLVAIPCLA